MYVQDSGAMYSRIKEGLTADPAVILDVTVSSSPGVGYDSAAMLEDVRRRVGIS